MSNNAALDGSLIALSAQLEQQVKQQNMCKRGADPAHMQQLLDQLQDVCLTVAPDSCAHAQHCLEHTAGTVLSALQCMLQHLDINCLQPDSIATLQTGLALLFQLAEAPSITQLLQCSPAAADVATLLIELRDCGEAFADVSDAGFALLCLCEAAGPRSAPGSQRHAGAVGSCNTAPTAKDAPADASAAHAHVDHQPCGQVRLIWLCLD